VGIHGRIVIFSKSSFDRGKKCGAKTLKKEKKYAILKNPTPKF
jgi:hypothetical protein